MVYLLLLLTTTIATGDFPQSEQHGQEFIASLGLNGVWKQTSYNNNFRGKFAGSGYLYIEDADIFVEPAPYPSWVLDSSYEWIAPIQMPSVGGPYIWNEEIVNWEKIVNEVEIGDTTFVELT